MISYWAAENVRLTISVTQVLNAPRFLGSESENWRKRKNEEFMQLFGDLDIFWFFIISLLNWIGHVNRTDSKRKVSQVFTNNAEGSGLTGWPKTDIGIVYKQLPINTSQIGTIGQKAELTGRSALRGRRCALGGCRANEGGGGEGGDGEGEGGKG